MNPSIVEQLSQGTAFADLSGWSTVAVDGEDARSWLDGLVTASLARLGPGDGVPSLLLTPTGRIRAAFTVTALDEGLLLIQDPSQPESMLAALAPFVLSSDVRLRDRTGRLSLLSFPGRSRVASIAGLTTATPSCLGRGVDLIGPAELHDAVVADLRGRFVLASGEELDAWRVAAGEPRLGVDVLPDDLPQEAGLEDAIAFDKGCFLGQEAVARVRNLGHPRRLLLRLEGSGGPIAAGDAIAAGDGRVTSVARLNGRTVVRARVPWGMRGGPFQTSAGIELRPFEP